MKENSLFFFRVKSIDAKTLGYKPEVVVGEGGVDGREMTGSRWFQSCLRMVHVSVIQHTWCFLTPQGPRTESSVKRRRKWHPTPLFLPGESNGQRSLVGYGPWGRRVAYD